MYELIQAAGNSYYIQSPAKIGLVRLNEKEVCLIDSGNDKNAGRKVRQILDANGWRLTAIYNTHSHADHIGGNQYLQKQTGCRIYAPGIECSYTRHPILEPVSLYGGCPPKDLRHKFLMAQQSEAEYLTEAALPKHASDDESNHIFKDNQADNSADKPGGFSDGGRILKSVEESGEKSAHSILEIIPLPGHCFEMAGFRTADDVVYLADCLSSRETLEKYQIGYIYDVAAYLDTLDKVRSLKAKLFIPSHAEPTQEIAPLAELNIAKVCEIGEKIVDICSSPASFEQILQKLFTEYHLQMNFEQYVLVGSTVRSYLAWLKDGERIDVEFRENMAYWSACR
ncbi:MAG: MBL fold metallo-hydrolase [Lachnospiraceae bacterium]|nr:MBL fold metallo-hydrolase [Lachnospiraceae bacterium]